MRILLALLLKIVLINDSSASARRPEDLYADPGYTSSMYRTPEQHRQQHSLRSSMSAHEQHTPSHGHSHSGISQARDDDNDEVGPLELSQTHHMAKSEEDEDEQRHPKSEGSSNLSDDPMDVSPTEEEKGE